jgi:hypothetical protein
MSLIVSHNGGFFSCCSERLNHIFNYINTHKKLPLVVDSSKQFELYKQSNEDITFDYFEHYDKIENNIFFNIKYRTPHQFKSYSILDFKNTNPLIQKYFTPSDNIKEIINNFEKKYLLQYDNICVLFYRGNDKAKETKLSGYNEYIEYANSIIAKTPLIKFLVQSDETEFIELMLKIFPENSFYFNDEIRHINKSMRTVDKVFKEQNHIFSKYYLAITIIMSKCKYIICGSGNCSMWIMFYRNNCNNVYQHSKYGFIIHGSE